MRSKRKKASRCAKTGCGSQRLLRCRSHPAGRGPNSSSLFPPLAAVVAVALFSRFSNLLLRSRLYALAERKVLLKRNTLGGAVNRRSPKNAFSEAASIFPLRLPLRGLKGASSPFLATATTAASGGNREELLGQRPAGCERQRSRRWEPQPVGSSASKSLVVFWFSFDIKREQLALMKKRSAPRTGARTSSKKNQPCATGAPARSA